MNILSVRNLSVVYERNRSSINALRDVSFDLREGETLSLVGESGCGKSTTALSLLGLIFPHEGRIAAGEILFGGRNLLANTPEEWRRLRGREISLVFQDPFTSLNPVLTIGEQLMEAVTAHQPGLPKVRLLETAREALREVLLTDFARVLGAYPHQLSGGQRQRVAMAMAIVNRPKILIADEPTTALDVTIQKEIMDLLDRLKKELSLTLLLITHNLPMSAERSERIAVMYAGRIVEIGTRDAVFNSPRHPYTKGLIGSVLTLGTRLDTVPPMPGQPPDLSALPPGCAFRPRCAGALDVCGEREPGFDGPGESSARCFLCDQQKGGA